MLSNHHTPTRPLADPRAFERLYEQHRPLAFRAANAVLRDRAAAEDVVQDVFAHLWDRPGAFDARRGSLRTYVAMTARSRAIDRRRSQAAGRAALERMRADAWAGPARERGADDRAIERDRSARVGSIVDRLPADQREAILLAYGRDLTTREIGRVTGVPTATAKSRVRLGLTKLRASAELVR